MKDEIRLMNESQKSVVDKLARNGWRVDLYADAWAEDGTVYLSRRDRKLRSMTHYVEVGRDGTLHGQL